MTDSDNSQPQDDCDEDIYKDIPEFNFEDELAKLEGSKETYKQEAYDLSEKVKNLTEENKELKKSNEVLKKNLSVLLKTAQAEVQRKDSVIEELRSKVESFTFRRNKKPGIDKVTSTDDLYYNFAELKQDCERQKSDREKKISKSYETCTDSDSEQRSNQRHGKKSEFQGGKEKNFSCDNGRKSSSHRESTQNSNSRQSESSHDTQNERHKGRKSTKYETSSSQRRPFRESYRDHCLYDSFDKKRHSRSSDNRFLSRGRSSRERRRDHRKSESSERRNRSRRREESERSRRDSRKNRSRSFESKESSLEKLKSRVSLDSDRGRSKEEMGGRLEGSKSVGNDVECKKRNENYEKKTFERNGVIGTGRSKESKEKVSCKHEKRVNLDMFNAKSPLDALYNDMVASRSSNRALNPKVGTADGESDLEDGEIFGAESETNQINEDWTLSFKNERVNEAKPITLYSKRMMQKFSSKSKEEESANKNKKEKVDRSAERKIVEKAMEREKEPGELTDDENIIESSKEFQELTKVAAIKSEMIEKSEKGFLKEPITLEFVENGSNTKLDQCPKDQEKESQKEFEKDGLEKPILCKDVESSKETCDVIEFSPFKNNYKLIEISPIKSTENERILDYFNKKPPVTNREERTNLDSLDGKAKPEKDGADALADTCKENTSWENSSENDSEIKLQIENCCAKENTKEKEKADEKATKEEFQRNKEKDTLQKKEKKSKEEINFKKEKRKSNLRKETDKPVTKERAPKRKRKLSEAEEEKFEAKKPKVQKNEPLRKSTRSKRSSKSETEGKEKEEREASPVKEAEGDTKEDISDFEFFKPIATRGEASETPTDVSKTDYEMTATMSVTGVVRLKTPNKCVGKLKNLMINEQVIFNVFDAKSNQQFSPVVGSKSVEMTPRRMLKNDLMLTDSEDDSTPNKNSAEGENGEVEDEGNLSRSEHSDWYSDSEASDFVDLL